METENHLEVFMKKVLVVDDEESIRTPEFITLYFANPSLPLDRTVFFSLFLKFILLYMVVYDIMESWLTLKRQLIKKDEHMSIL